MPTGAILFALLVTMTTAIFFFGLWQLGRKLDPVSKRLQEYDPDTYLNAEAEQERKGGLFGLFKRAGGTSLVERLEGDLAQAHLPLQVQEYLTMIVGAAALGFALGAWRAGFGGGILLGVIFGAAPLIYVRISRDRSRRKFTQQLPDVLMLLVGALRAGYGLVQALRTLADQLPSPAREEFARAVRAISLGVPIKRALTDLSKRAGSDDVELVITAIIVQYEMGGNLAQTLEAIGDTIRDRIDMQNEMASLTAEERMSSAVVGSLPTVAGVVMYFMNPDFMKPLFEPGLIRLLPAAAVLLQIAGFLVIRRITKVDI